MSHHFIEIIDQAQFDLEKLAGQVHGLVCRTDFSQPGFVLVRLPCNETSGGQRRKMVDLKETLSKLHYQKTYLYLEWFNMTRFHQKNTTKLHRDGAPNESILILGYEPTTVTSDITMADYSRCAYEMGITPDEFLQEFNPMYEKGLEKLAHFTTAVGEFDSSTFQILVVNNSSNPLSRTAPQWQGVLHSARVSNGEAPRIINSTCVAPSNLFKAETIGPAQLSAFLETDDLSGTYS